jgi:hypothetical protein
MFVRSTKGFQNSIVGEDQNFFALINEFSSEQEILVPLCNNNRLLNERSLVG